MEGIYTTKGALEMVRWQKYKKFLNDFTLIKDRKIDSVIVLEKHLAYSMVLKVNKSYEKAIIEGLESKYCINLKDIEYVIKMKYTQNTNKE